MGCDPLYGPGRNVVGVCCCTEGSRRKRKCRFCGGRGDRLCDGILRVVRGDLLADSGDLELAMCNAPVCASCAVSIAALDRDYCPRCIQQEPLVCAVGPSAEHPCRGPTVDRDGLCLAHSLLFTHWLRACGGADIYADPALSREEKRQRFRTWLASLSEGNVRGVFARVGWRF